MYESVGEQTERDFLKSEVQNLTNDQGQNDDNQNNFSF